MKRILSILFVIVLGVSVLDAQVLDSLTKVSLREKIEAYFGALAGESLEVQKEEADFMIELSADSLVRQFTAARIYEHYVGSKVMGAENVAVHVFDKWFRDGKLKMDSDMDFMNAKIYADFNRQSLIGERAPELVMEDMEGRQVRLFGREDKGGGYRVLFFYDAGCAKCKLESILLGNMLETEDFPIEFYAVYVGDSREAWEEYVKERFETGDGLEEEIGSYEHGPVKMVALKKGTEVEHLWDPEMDSDFQRKYGVLQTPRMFLVNPKGVIIGRGLDARALRMMLDRIFDDVALEYGGKESAALFDGIFAGQTTVDDVKRIVDYVEESTLGQDNPVMFKQLAGDMLYWLSTRPGEAFKEGADYLIDSLILSRPDIWRSADDSLKVIGLAKFMDGLLDKAKPGTGIEGIEVPGERLKGAKTKDGTFRLDKLGGRRNIIIFYTEGCGNCDAEKAMARRFVMHDKRVRILLVNVDGILADTPDLSARLFETFDLSTLPFIVETDRRGTILRRYISLVSAVQ